VFFFCLDCSSNSFSNFVHLDVMAYVYSLSNWASYCSLDIVSLFASIVEMSVCFSLLSAWMALVCAYMMSLSYLTPLGWAVSLICVEFLGGSLDYSEGDSSSCDYPFLMTCPCSIDISWFSGTGSLHPGIAPINRVYFKQCS